ncbi:MAG TPA: YggT family protein [Devosiaceae bacterium]|jgi:YggT family protein|nr:YggT family protein [Devosiaceae bacterium]
MRAILDIILLVLQLYWWIVIAMIIMSWLISFNVINTRNQFVAAVWRILNQLTDPVLQPIRRVMPNFGGLDISPIILFLIIFFIERLILYYVYPNVF